MPAQKSGAEKATQINLLDVNSVPMRTFHVTWVAFFLCFFAWFAIAPLMAIVRKELALTDAQVGLCMVASVAATIVARLGVGWLCDWYGPRLTYTWLLLLGSLPVMGIGLSHDFTSFLLFRLAISAIGAAFVVTQYHTTRMFDSGCVGTANATTAGWGNLGGGVTQFVMPLIFAGFVTLLGFSDEGAWRGAMVVAGALCAAWAPVYYFTTQDTPAGNFADLASDQQPSVTPGDAAALFKEASRDARVWVLFIAYGACFGIELTIKNIAALYFIDYFGLDLVTAGFCAAAYGGMNLFARTLGGWMADRAGATAGFQGRAWWLLATLIGEGVLLIIFAQVTWLAIAAPLLMLFAAFVQMAAGATYALVPFVQPRALGAVTAIVGAGGNLFAVMFAALFTLGYPWPAVLTTLGAVVLVSSGSVLLLLRYPAEAIDPTPAPAAPALALDEATAV